MLDIPVLLFIVDLGYFRTELEREGIKVPHEFVNPEAPEPQELVRIAVRIQDWF